jgi:hypothetical protein
MITLVARYAREKKSWAATANLAFNKKKVLFSGVPRGVWGVQTPTRNSEAEPNSRFRGKYIRNNLTRIQLSLIF